MNESNQVFYGDDIGARMFQEFQSEITRLRRENNEMLLQREVREREYENVMFENQTLYNKLENLENVFIGQPSQKSGKPSDGKLS